MIFSFQGPAGSVASSKTTNGLGFYFSLTQAIKTSAGLLVSVKNNSTNQVLFNSNSSWYYSSGSPLTYLSYYRGLFDNNYNYKLFASNIFGNIYKKNIIPIASDKYYDKTTKVTITMSGLIGNDKINFIAQFIDYNVGNNKIINIITSSGYITSTEYITSSGYITSTTFITVNESVNFNPLSLNGCCLWMDANDINTITLKMLFLHG